MLALCLDEPGADEVLSVIEANEAWIAAVSWLELWIKFDRSIYGQEALALYEASLAGTVDITRDVAAAAREIRKGAQSRIPVAEALIAGAARAHGMRLLHRDAHFSGIPARLLKQKMLPPK